MSLENVGLLHTTSAIIRHFSWRGHSKTQVRAFLESEPDRERCPSRVPGSFSISSFSPVSHSFIRCTLQNYKMPEPISVLFVCLGNICRSTMAEGIFQSLAQQPQYKDKIGKIDSCGTGEGKKTKKKKTCLFSINPLPSHFGKQLTWLLSRVPKLHTTPAMSRTRGHFLPSKTTASRPTSIRRGV